MMDQHASNKSLGRRGRRVVGMVGTAAIGCAALAGATTTGPANAAEPAPQPFTIKTPKQAYTIWNYDGEADVQLPIRIQANDQAFELRSNRSASYKTRIKTVWKSANGDVALPLGSMRNFGGLHDFFRVKIVDSAGKVRYSGDLDACLNGDAQRVLPDAPARNNYPNGCPNHQYTLGSVMGIQAGWSSSLYLPLGNMKLKPGRYRATVRVRAPYPAVFGMTGGTGGTFPIVVKKEAGAPRTGKPTPKPSRIARPSRTTAPAQASAGQVANAPDLRSLPAYGAVVSGGKWLNFSATVWNAGTGPLVVDGFPTDDADKMSAYQYFFNAAGEETGHRAVGNFHWHAANHNHWHFEDFASYQLLDANKKLLKTSGKVSFCLANTDAVDYTLPGADWNPENTDLATACGERDSVAIREVLAAGSGDTYMQYRSGQAFFIANVPNGDYYIRITANPRNGLVETDKTNNVSLRKVTLSGPASARKVTLAKVGMINEVPVTEEEFGEHARTAFMH